MLIMDLCFQQGGKGMALKPEILRRECYHYSVETDSHIAGIQPKHLNIRVSRTGKLHYFKTLSKIIRSFPQKLPKFSLKFTHLGTNLLTSNNQHFLFSSVDQCTTTPQARRIRQQDWHSGSVYRRTNYRYSPGFPRVQDLRCQKWWYILFIRR